jgi:hypothetical protein
MNLQMLESANYGGHAGMRSSGKAAEFGDMALSGAPAIQGSRKSILTPNSQIPIFL